ncbi:alpha/beta fold hydrolase [Pseudoalteromonas maricaloris]|uniref:alpha/beta fold hydrolase n=1 Tax=Pseudoalteromonas maricaloris TaxID=184924 RepID=UPI003C182CFA
MFYSQSKQLESHLPEIDKHWQGCQKGFFDTPHGRLFYAYHIPEKATFSLVLVNGRIESAHKYRELLWEFAQNNIAVFTYDHPGQGYSPRLLKDKQIGYVRRFEDYAATLHCFMDQIVAKQNTLPLFILAHSMGGAITCDYLTLFAPHNIEGVYLSAPMLGINTTPYPAWFAEGLAGAACLFGLGKHYALGQVHYHNKPFQDNDLTDCPIRYALFRGLYDQFPELQLGGVSFAWLYTALHKCRSFQDIKLDLPIRIATASEDSIVDNQAQVHFAAHRDNVTVTEFIGKHELLCEQDNTRKAVLDDFYAFTAELLSAKETGS